MFKGVKDMPYYKNTNKYFISGFYNLDYYLSQNINNNNPKYFF